MEFQKKLAVELSTGQITLSEISKRERISVQTLSKWRDKYGLGDRIGKSEMDSIEVSVNLDLKVALKFFNVL